MTEERGERVEDREERTENRTEDRTGKMTVKRAGGRWVGGLCEILLQSSAETVKAAICPKDLEWYHAMLFLALPLTLNYLVQQNKCWYNVCLLPVMRPPSPEAAFDAKSQTASVQLPVTHGGVLPSESCLPLGYSRVQNLFVPGFEVIKFLLGKP